jgi:hypothetical protein
LISKIDNTPMKDDREALLSQVKTNIQVIEQEHKILSKQNKKQKNRTLKMNANKQLQDCAKTIEDLKVLISRQEENLENDTVVLQIQNEEIDDESTEITKKYVNDQATLQYYDNVDKEFQQGVNDTKKLLKNIKLVNMQLDDISMLVFEQRNKLNSIQGEIKTSQDLMNRTKKIMKTFSAELVKDNVIKVLLALITIVLLFIMVCAVKYKMKSQALIGKEIDVTDSNVDYDQIDEALFWKMEIREFNKSEHKKKDENTLKQKKHKVNNDLMDLDVEEKSNKH